MPITLNASTASGLVVTPDNSGNIVLQYNGVATPTFRATNTAYQSISGSTTTKVIFPTKTFDTANYFDNTTNYRFTPLTAGYYQINSVINGNGNNTAWARGFIYKNGSVYSGYGVQCSTSSAGYGIMLSDIVYMNGSTDYIEIYAFFSNADTLNINIGNSFFAGCLLRGA